VLLAAAFGLPLAGDMEPGTQFALIAVAGFVMTCTVGPVSAVVIDVIHPGVRATGAAVLAVFQNLFGLAAGPLLAGLLSDAYGLPAALALTPLFAIVAAIAFILAARTYEADAQRAAITE
jgi:MFS transporter, Spinster family, sphingosine-1-phosphate transporter